MSHLQLLLTAINITLGSAVIILLFSGRIKYGRESCSKTVALHTLFYNMLLWMAVGDKYLRLNIPGSVEYTDSPFYSAAGDLLFFILITGMTLSILSFRKIFAGKKYRKQLSSVRNIILITAVLLLIAGSVNIKYQLAAIDYIFESGCDLMFFLEAGIIISLLITGLKNRDIDGFLKKLIFSFSLLYLLRYLFIIFPIAIEKERFLLSMLMLFYCNLAPLGWYLVYQQHGSGNLHFRSLKAEYGISDREGDVLELLLAGKSNHEIADRLCISPHTAKNHIFNIYSKTNVRSRYQIMKMFL